jgi:hypothetical protein
VKYLKAFLAAQDPPLPCVIFLHGRGGLTPTYADGLRLLASGETPGHNEFVVLMPLLGTEPDWLANQDIVRRLLDSLPAEADRRAIFLMGHDTGARAAATMLSSFPSVFRGAILVSEIDAEYGGRVPLLVIAGTSDPSLDSIRGSAKTMAARGVAVEVDTIPGGRHLITKQPEAWAAKTGDWITKILAAK